MAEDERPDSPQDNEDLAGSGAAGEPSEGAGEAETPPAGDGGELAASGAAGEPSEGAPAEDAESAEAPAEQPASEGEAAEEPAAEPPPPAEEPQTDEPQAAEPEGEAPQPERPQRRRQESTEESGQPDVVPGAHLEPDLVLEPEAGGEEDEFARYAADGGEEAASEAEVPAAVEEQPQPVARTPVDLAADARYKATGKRKTAVARVVVRPGGGSYTVNGRTLEEFFPRPTLQRTARQPLEAAGYETRMDVVARIHGGGVSAQAGALRHGIARALVEADPNLRTELKRRGFLTRDAREKERKKAGLKKARKRPQFSKR
jgi:small subunit ribosomal protein S9